jgi:hypothetical protein
MALRLHPGQVIVRGDGQRSAGVKFRVVPLARVGQQRRHQEVASGQLYRNDAPPDHGKNGSQVGASRFTASRVAADARPADQQVNIRGSNLLRCCGQPFGEQLKSGRPTTQHAFAGGEMEPGKAFG